MGTPKPSLRFHLFQDSTHLIALIILAGLITLALLIASFGDGDFFQYYQAGRLLLRGSNPYSLAAHVEMHGHGFPYPPGAIFLTLPITMIPFGFALIVWDVLGLLLLVASIHLWTTFIWKRDVGFSQQTGILLCSFIAPCYWAFLMHNVIIPVFFLATGALWLLRKRCSFAAGLAVGLMLIKPHLTLLLAVLLLIKAPRKGIFAAGVLGMILLTFLPFFAGYRPPSDLVQAWQSAKFYATQVYVQDDQDLAANGFRLLMDPATKDGLQVLDRSGRSDSSVLPGGFARLNQIKDVIFLMTLAAWIFISRKAASDTLAKYAALALALGLLTSRYSHAYDGVMLVPWVLFAVYHASKTIDLTKMAGCLFLLNYFVLTLWIPMGRQMNAFYWTRTGWYAVLYFLMGFPLFSDGIQRLSMSISGLFRKNAQILHKSNLSVTRV